MTLFLMKIAENKFFYRDHYRKIVKILFWAVMVIYIEVGFIMYLGLIRSEPRYYATSNDGEVVPLSTTPPKATTNQST